MSVRDGGGGMLGRVWRFAPNARICTQRRVCAKNMLKVKDTLRSTVNLTFDGRVIKTYRGPKAEQRFDQEVKVLRFLEARGCNFVPRLLEADRERLRIVTTNCGGRVEHIDQKRLNELFAELESYGVKHDDPEMRNVTYRPSDGRFCVIDFEFASILPDFQQHGASN
jgi:tRNA A-37 threonylcarbamoyl transferase component Bud32